MTAPHCPTCGQRIRRNQALFAVLKTAKKPTPIKQLAWAYAKRTRVDLRSARRAIERYAERGLLIRAASGIYWAAR